jgi:hypothetical protein
MVRNRYSHALGRLLTLVAVTLALASVATAEWKEKVLYSFQGGTNDGAFPAGGVVFDKQGNLYGVLQDYGPPSCAPMGNYCGTVFQLTPPAQKGGSWTETLIYQFQGKGSNDASLPNGGLIRDAAGNLYGVTAYGGTGDCVLLGVKAGCGTVYELSPPTQKGGAWTETILYSFPTAKQGYLPNGDLVLDIAGNLYGATTFGGGYGTTCNGFYQYCGAVFQLSPPKIKGGKWREKVLYGFKGVAAGAQFGDGANPNGGLVLDSKGAIYGTTYFGGNNVKGKCEGGVGGTGCGIIFKLIPPSQKGGKWTEKVLHVFKGGNDGDHPAAGMIFGDNGYLYGTTLNGAAGGTAFFLAPPAKGSSEWKEAILHGFNENGGPFDPEAALIFDSAGNLYGTTYVGNFNDLQGSVFRLKPSNMNGAPWTFSVIHGFLGPPDGDFPAASLVLDKNGDVYGTTQAGGIGTGCGHGGCGTVFEVSP